MLVDSGAELVGPNGWQGPGWTAPAPGRHHYPEVRGGALIALFHYPAGCLRDGNRAHPQRVAPTPAAVRQAHRPVPGEAPPYPDA
ncbi:4-hydroxylaminobenzoate lyase [Streptomyces spinosirectus]